MIKDYMQVDVLRIEHPIISLGQQLQQRQHLDNILTFGAENLSPQTS